MIQMGTLLTVADNSGARKLFAIRQLGGSSAPRYAGLGDIIVCSVKEAAPESDVKKGTVVKAVIVKKDPDLDADTIIEYCHEYLTGYKVPKIVEFRDELPKTNVGKILRRELRTSR